MEVGLAIAISLAVVFLGLWVCAARERDTLRDKLERRTAEAQDEERKYDREYIRRCDAEDRNTEALNRIKALEAELDETESRMARMVTIACGGEVEAE